MRTTNSAFAGLEFYVGKLGDQTAVSLAFWAPLAGSSLELAGNPWDEEVASLLDTSVQGGSGPEFASPATQVGVPSSWFLEGTPSPLDQMLADGPEAVLCILGTNDILGSDASGSIRPGFDANLTAIVERILAASSIPILVTVHPQVDREALVRQMNTIICDVGATWSVPVVDFHAEVLERQPANWASVLLAADGTSLGNSTGIPGDFTTANLNSNGYALLNYVCLKAYSDVYRDVLVN